MTDIEITVSFVALLGGLLLANVANNMADALRTRRDLPIGFVPWAINFYIAAAVINTFALFLQADSPQSYDMIMLAAVLATFMPYIMVSRLLYPGDKERWDSIEDHYIANRKLFLGLMVIPPAITVPSWIYQRDNFGVTLTEMAVPLLILFGPVIITLLLLMMTDKRGLHRAGFGFLIIHRIAMMSWLALSAP